MWTIQMCSLGINSDPPLCVWFGQRYCLPVPGSWDQQCWRWPRVGVIGFGHPLKHRRSHRHRVYQVARPVRRRRSPILMVRSPVPILVVSKRWRSPPARLLLPIVLIRSCLVGRWRRFGARTWRSLGGTCQSAVTPFTDIAGSFAAADIGCIWTLAVTHGTGATTFSPNKAVTREQMAALLARTIRALAA